MSTCCEGGRLMRRRNPGLVSIVMFLVFFAAIARGAESGTLHTDHVNVRYSGITEAQAKSLARVAAAARKAASERYGFEVPETIQINVDCRPGNTVRLFTDGHDTYTLSLQ